MDFCKGLVRQGSFSVDSKELAEALARLGVVAGDLILVHSDLRPFGLPQKCTSEEDILNFWFKAFKEILGPKGTLAVPAYFYEFARVGEPFHVDSSPVSKPLGVFSSYVNTHPHRVRSLNPLQSISAVGYRAQALCGHESFAGYGVTSPWHHLRKLRGKIVFIGTTLQPMTYVHHIEQQFGVPHLYTKIYPYPVFKNGVQLEGKVTSAVRYLDYGIEYDLASFQMELQRKGVLQSALLRGVPLYAVGAEEAFRVGIHLLQRNPYAFLKKPPAFIPGKIPTDGMTGQKL
jgi:aminoglycoside 3-N-acetyltransferase